MSKFHFFSYFFTLLNIYTIITTPFFALIPRAVSPLLTAFSAYSIYNNFPFEEKVVNENSPIFNIIEIILLSLNQ